MIGYEISILPRYAHLLNYLLIRPLDLCEAIA